MSKQDWGETPSRQLPVQPWTMQVCPFPHSATVKDRGGGGDEAGGGGGDGEADGGGDGEADGGEGEAEGGGGDGDTDTSSLMAAMMWCRKLSKCLFTVQVYNLVPVRTKL